MPKCSASEAATLALLLIGCATPPVWAADAVPDYVRAAVDDPGRPPGDIERDPLRKPAELLTFSGVKPGDKVADLVPGEGYYTRILAKLVGPAGHVYSFVPVVGYVQPIRKAERELMAQGIVPPPNPVDVALEIQNIAEYRNVTVIWEQLKWGPTGGMFGVPEQLDMVFSSDSYHDLHNAENGDLDMVAVDKAIFGALKPGGTFLLTDHAAAAGAGFTQTETLHRAEPAAEKAEVLAAGFVLDRESGILANPKDDHTQPIFDMPDKTDRFLFRFKKPEGAPNTDRRPGDDAMVGYFGNTAIYGVGSKGARHIFYHRDHTYQEFGKLGTTMQSGRWFFEATGQVCLIHQFPADEREAVVCHLTHRYPKIGDTWTEDSGQGPSGPITLVAGYVHP